MWITLFRFLTISLILGHSQALVFSQAKPKQGGQAVTSYWGNKTAAEIAQELEEVKEQIDYCLKNVGKKVEEVDLSKMGQDAASMSSISGGVTYGVIAYKQHNPAKAATYFYKDWQEFKKDWTGKNSLWREGPGDYHPLAAAIFSWKEAGMYDEALKHYQEYFEDQFLSYYGNTEETLKYLREQTTDPGLRREYDEFMAEWERTKKLSEAGVPPKPLEPEVQNHEWFYSDKQEKVLKALNYYHSHKVKFMLEKALNHKNRVVAKKAKGYLKQLERDKRDEPRSK